MTTVEPEPFAGEPEPLRLLVVADDPLARAGLRLMLEAEPGCRIIGQTPPTPSLHQDVEVYRPDVVIWDLGWEGDSEALLQLAEVVEGGFPVLALFGNAGQAGDVWDAGARGLLSRAADGPVLAAAASSLAHGLAALEPDYVGFTGSISAPQLDEPLTPRELEVLALVAEGLSNRAVGASLGISEHTVKFHVTAIMAKLEAQSRTEAVVRATRLGLLSL